MDEWKITGESKVRNRIEIPGTGISKFVEKTWISRGVQKCKKKKYIKIIFQGFMLTKKIQYSQHGNINFFL